MAVKLRLTRTGTKKRPYYRLLATDSRRPKGGKHLEILGTYDPMNLSVSKTSTQKDEKGRVDLKTDRVQYWLGVGAEPSPTVATLLKRLSISKVKAA